MKKLICFSLLFAALGKVNFSYAHSHVKHNMVLFGEHEIFASHLVYKHPHNYQVVLALDLTQEERRIYLALRRQHPNGLIKFLLDPMNIKDIRSQESITGPRIYEDDGGKDHEVLARLTVPRNKFSVIYFDELPLDLSSKAANKAELNVSDSILDPNYEPPNFPMEKRHCCETGKQPCNWKC